MTMLVTAPYWLQPLMTFQLYGYRMQAGLRLEVLVAEGAEGAEEGTAPLRSALFFVFMSSVTFLRPDVTMSPCNPQHRPKYTLNPKL